MTENSLTSHLHQIKESTYFIWLYLTCFLLLNDLGQFGFSSYASSAFYRLPCGGWALVLLKEQPMCFSMFFLYTSSTVRGISQSCFLVLLGCLNHHHLNKNRCCSCVVLPLIKLTNVTSELLCCAWEHLGSSLKHRLCAPWGKGCVWDMINGIEHPFVSTDYNQKIQCACICVPTWCSVTFTSVFRITLQQLHTGKIDHFQHICLEECAYNLWVQ